MTINPDKSPLKNETDENILRSVDPEVEVSEKSFPVLLMMVATIIWGVMAAGILLWTVFKEVQW